MEHASRMYRCVNDSTIWFYLRYTTSRTADGTALVVRWNADLAMLGRDGKTGLVQTGNIELSTPYTQHRIICGDFPARHASKGSGEKQAMFGAYTKRKVYRETPWAYRINAGSSEAIHKSRRCALANTPPTPTTSVRVQVAYLYA